jgi:PAP2 superfamily
MKNKLSLIWAAAIGIVLVIGSVVATLVISPLLTAGTNSNAAANGNAANGSSASGAFVIAWNKELLHIVLTPGAQPATIHPTRSYAILHAAIYDALVSITRDAPAYAFSVNAPLGARPDAAAATAGHDTLVALYPKWKAALDQQLASELATIPDGAGKQGGSQVGQAVAARLLAIRAANTAGNPAIGGDSTWTPLVVTALDPDYPAAHAVISADAATALAAFFGNKDQIRVTSDVLPGVVTTYTSYSDVATEAGLSRIYAGNHTRIAVDVGNTLGNNVAQFVISDLGV